MDKAAAIQSVSDDIRRALSRHFRIPDDREPFREARVPQVTGGLISIVIDSDGNPDIDGVSVLPGGALVDEAGTTAVVAWELDVVDDLPIDALQEGKNALSRLPTGRSLLVRGVTIVIPSETDSRFVRYVDWNSVAAQLGDVGGSVSAPQELIPVVPRQGPESPLDA